jgi:hypothetical protein
VNAGIVIRGPRLPLRALSASEIDEEWQALVDADPMVIATPPDEEVFRARLRRSGRLVDGELDLAIDLDGTLIGRIQTFLPRAAPCPRGLSTWGSACVSTPRARAMAARPWPC